MNYARGEEGEALVLSIRGELDAVSVETVRETLDEIVAAKRKQVIVDLSGLKMIDSSGVGSIVSLYKRVRAYGANMSVRGAKGQPLEIFRLLKLDRVLATGEEAAA